MGGHGRHFAGHEDFPGALVVEMAGVHDHVHGFHGFNDFPAPFRNAPVFSFHAVGKSDFIGIVPGERHETDAVFVHALQLLHAAACRFTAFHGKEGADFPLFLRFPQVLPAADGAEEMVPCFQFSSEGGKEVLIPPPYIRRLLPVHPEGKILDEAASPFQLLQVNVERILHEGPLLPMVMEFGNGITVEIDVFHGALPQKIKGAGF